MKNIFFLFLLAVLAPVAVGAQSVAVKTNVLYLGTGSPNLGVEFGMGKHLTLSLAGGANDLKLNARPKDGTTPSLKHIVGDVEVRYWFCKRFDGAFLGLQGLGGRYIVEDIMFVNLPKNYRYDGTGFSGGLVFGYQWILGRRWGMEASIAGGVARLNYDKYRQGGGEYLGEFKQTYVGPTKLNFSFMYFFK